MVCFRLSIFNSNANINYLLRRASRLSPPFTYKEPFYHQFETSMLEWNLSRLENESTFWAWLERKDGQQHIAFERAFSNFILFKCNDQYLPRQWLLEIKKTILIYNKTDSDNWLKLDFVNRLSISKNGFHLDKVQRHSWPINQLKEYLKQLELICVGV